jgi:hypothetical protein
MSTLNALLEDPTVLRAVAEHVALPPKLPQSELEDDGEGAVERAICALAVASAQGFASELLIEQRGVWERMAKTIETLALILDEKETTNISLLTVLQEMKEGGTCATIHGVSPRTYQTHIRCGCRSCQGPERSCGGTEAGKIYFV